MSFSQVLSKFKCKSAENDQVLDKMWMVTVRKIGNKYECNFNSAISQRHRGIGITFE